MLRRIRDDFLAMLPWSLRRLSTVHRKALAVTLISLVGWSLWNGLRELDHPWGDLSRGKFTDHFSHMNAARAFLVVGRDIWRKPIAAQFRLLTPGGAAGHTAGHPGRRERHGRRLSRPGMAERQASRRKLV